MPSAMDEALRYVSLGMSVIPVQPDKTPLICTTRGFLVPGGKLRPYQLTPAGATEVRSWFRMAPNAGVAIYCGGVSGNIAVLDVDFKPASEWMIDNLAGLLSHTWVVLTGSGKIHIYVRTTEPTYTTAINAGDLHLADIRADGTPPRDASYVVAPPSPYNHKGVVGSYSTLMGSPEQIASVGNAADFFHKLVRKAAASLNGQIPDATARTLVSIISPVSTISTARMGIRPAGDPQELGQIIRACGITGKIQRAILKGAEPGKGEFKNCPTHSEVDYIVVARLKERGVDDDTIEDIYATFPIGSARYRNTEQTSNGRQYLQYILDKITARMAAAKQAIQQAKGANFEIVRAFKVMYETPIHELHIRDSDGDLDIVRMDTDTLMNERRFRIRVAEVMNFTPELTSDQAMRGFEATVVQGIFGIETVEEPPKDATATGLLLGKVLNALSGKLSPSKPPETELALIGWRDEKMGIAVIRGNALQEYLAQATRTAPDPAKVWDAIRTLGGSQVLLEERGETVEMWALPLKHLKRRSGE